MFCFIDLDSKYEFKCLAVRLNIVKYHDSASLKCKIQSAKAWNTERGG